MLYGGLTVEQAMSGRSKIRNVCIAEVFSRMGIIEQWGTGFQRMMQGCRTYGVQDPEVIDMGDSLRVNFYRSVIETNIETIKTDLETNIETEKLSNTERKIIQLVQDHPEITQEEMAETLGMSKSGIRYAIRKLKSKKILVREGATKKGKWMIVKNEERKMD